VHAALLRQVISFPSVARAAGGHHVGPVVVSASGERDEVISGQAFAVSQVGLAPMTILTAIAISSKKECVGDLATEPARNMDELDEPYDCRFGEYQSFASDNVAAVRFDDLGFPLDDQPEGTPHRYHSERFKRGV
jgi:hypothetical protein